MSIHFSTKRPTRLKTDKVTDEKLKELSKNLKDLESTLSKFANVVRDGKDIAKELDKARQDTDKKTKDKDKAKGYEKEGKLVEKMNLNLAEINQLDGEFADNIANFYSNEALKVIGDPTINKKVLIDDFTRKLETKQE